MQASLTHLYQHNARESNHRQAHWWWCGCVIDFVRHCRNLEKSNQAEKTWFLAHQREERQWPDHTCIACTMHHILYVHDIKSIRFCVIAVQLLMFAYDAMPLTVVIAPLRARAQCRHHSYHTCCTCWWWLWYNMWLEQVKLDLWGRAHNELKTYFVNGCRLQLVSSRTINACGPNDWRLDDAHYTGA
jgi:hypothetical protein